MKLDEFLDKLDGVKRAGKGWVARCPAHEDREASLGISESDNSLLLTCYAGCETDAVLGALGLSMRDLYFNSFNHGEPEAVYMYTDEVGNKLFEAVRFPGKRFRQRHISESGEEVWNLDGVRRVLYGLPLVLGAVRNGVPIYLCEGEKDVESLLAIGKVATCNPMGAGKWRPEYTEQLSGAAYVVILVDRDEAGRRHAQTVKEALQGHVKNILLLQAAKGKDVTDHLEAGFTLDQLVPFKESRVRRGIITAGELADRALEDLELKPEDNPGFQFWPDVELIMRLGRVYSIAAYTGDGKTCGALQGVRTLGPLGTRMGYHSLEMPERDLRNRLVCHRGIPLKVLEEPWRLRQDSTLLAQYHQAVEELRAWNLDINFDSNVTAEKIAEITRDREHEVVFIDHLNRFGWSDRRHLEKEVGELTNLALEQNVMVVILCQLRKSSRGKDLDAYPRPTLQDFRETSVIGDDSSMALAIWRQRDPAGLSYTGATQVIVLKNRHTTGPQDAAGKTFMPEFDPARQMFLPKGIQLEKPDTGWH